MGQHRWAPAALSRRGFLALFLPIALSDAPAAAASPSSPCPGEVDLARFDPVGDGEADDLGAFQRAVRSVPRGSAVRIRACRPAVSYLLSGPLTAEGRAVTVVLEDGARVSGPGVLYVDRVESCAGSVVERHLRNASGGRPGEEQLVGDILRVESGGVAGIGSYYSYDSHAVDPENRNGGDVGRQIVCTWHGLSLRRPFAMFGAWIAAVPPVTSEADRRRGAAWGCVAAEWNPVYHGPDDGWRGSRGAQTWSVGIQVVPEGWAPTGNQGGHVLAAYVVAPCGSPNARRPGEAGGARSIASADGPFVPKSYNGLLVEHDAIAPGGRGVYLHGDTSGERGLRPETPLQAAGRWNRGIDLSEADFGGEPAVLLAEGQCVAFDRDGLFRLRRAGDRIVLSSGGREVFSIDEDGNLRVTGEVLQHAEL